GGAEAARMGAGWPRVGSRAGRGQGGRTAEAGVAGIGRLGLLALGLAGAAGVARAAAAEAAVVVAGDEQAVGAGRGAEPVVEVELLAAVLADAATVRAAAAPGAADEAGGPAARPLRHADVRRRVVGEVRA